MNYDYTEEDDIIEFDYESAINYISQGKEKIALLNSHCEELVNSLNILQEFAHDIEGSLLTEDYKDFEKILGDDGLKKFVEQIYECFDDVEITLKSWTSITNN